MEPLRVAVVGFGLIAQGYAADAKRNRHLRYSTHAQVLRDHPRFHWAAVVDPLPDRLAEASAQWNIVDVARSAAELCDCRAIDVLVLATPPDPAARVDVLSAFPNLRAVLVEKPLGIDLATATAFVAACRTRGLLVQVNLTRRGDATLRELATGGLAARLGPVQAAAGIYGNGLANNGTHMVDLVRLLLGEIESVTSLADERSRFAEGPIGGDRNIPFTLRLESGLNVTFAPVRFADYRENALDVWGRRGRLSYERGGFVASVRQVVDSPVLAQCSELAASPGQTLPLTLGDALYQLYTNLADALEVGSALWSSADSALRTVAVIDALVRSDDAGGARVPCELRQPAVA